MKTRVILLPILLSLSAIPASAIELADLTKSSTQQLKSAATEQLAPLETNAMVNFAAEQLNLSPNTVSAGLGSLLKVAKDNLSSDNFSLISKAIPDADKYVAKAPSISTDSLSSLLSGAGSAGKKADSLQYLNSAFEKLGISKEQVPALLNTFTGYLEKSGYGEAAGYLQKGLSFL